MKGSTYRYAAAGMWASMVVLAGYSPLMAEQGSQGGPATARTAPSLVTDRTLERTGFQEAAGYGGRYDLRTDFVMAYGVDAGIGERLKRWIAAGYVPQIMTGIAWGGYQDYLNGKFDGRRHWDEGQVNGAGKPIMHGADTPYMVPAVTFSDYLQNGIKRAIDAGAVGIHLEEPEFWADGGFGEAFKREWQIYYNEPWQRPDSSVDAQYRASKLKYYLYQRALNRLCSAMKEYALATHGRPVRFYVPTHSLINYTQWRIVSPESSLIDLPGIDGYIAQIWTGTARTANTYQGIHRERTFETAFLEYGIMQELVRGTDRRMWFLHDPVEDDPRHDWDDYRRNYLCTLVASLFQPGVWYYEVSPWPNRVFNGRFPHGSKDAKVIPPDYATILGIVFNQLRDMKQDEVQWPQTTQGVGVLLADSGMFQRANPAFKVGVAARKDDPTRATEGELRMWSAFYGMALPIVKRGIPLRPVQLDNITRFPGYLEPYRVLILSYEYMKPMAPSVHLSLAQWVQQGGSLIYVGADTDPFNQVREWWNRPGLSYKAPSEHLFESMGLPRTPEQGSYSFGKGRVLVERRHPAAITRSADEADRFRAVVQKAIEATGEKYLERNHFILRRGPYRIAACMDESRDKEPLKLQGRFVNLFDAALSVLTEVVVPLNRQAFLLDLDAVKGTPPLALASAGRLETWEPSDRALKYTTTSIEGVEVSTRLLLPAAPTQVNVDGQPCGRVEWDPASKTVLIRHAGRCQPTTVELRW